MQGETEHTRQAAAAVMRDSLDAGAKSKIRGACAVVVKENGSVDVVTGFDGFGGTSADEFPIGNEARRALVDIVLDTLGSPSKSMVSIALDAETGEHSVFLSAPGESDPEGHYEIAAQDLIDANHIAEHEEEKADIDPETRETDTESEADNDTEPETEEDAASVDDVASDTDPADEQNAPDFGTSDEGPSGLAGEVETVDDAESSADTGAEGDENVLSSAGETLARDESEVDHGSDEPEVPGYDEEDTAQRDIESAGSNEVVRESAFRETGSETVAELAVILAAQSAEKDILSAGVEDLRSFTFMHSTEPGDKPTGAVDAGGFVSTFDPSDETAQALRDIVASSGLDNEDFMLVQVSGDVATGEVTYHIRNASSGADVASSDDIDGDEKNAGSEQFIENEGTDDSGIEHVDPAPSRIGGSTLWSPVATTDTESDSVPRDEVEDGRPEHDSRDDDAESGAGTDEEVPAGDGLTDKDDLDSDSGRVDLADEEQDESAAEGGVTDGHEGNIRGVAGHDTPDSEDGESEEGDSQGGTVQAALFDAETGQEEKAADSEVDEDSSNTEENQVPSDGQLSLLDEGLDSDTRTPDPVLETGEEHDEADDDWLSPMLDDLSESIAKASGNFEHALDNPHAAVAFIDFDAGDMHSRSILDDGEAFDSDSETDDLIYDIVRRLILGSTGTEASGKRVAHFYCGSGGYRSMSTLVPDEDYDFRVDVQQSARDVVVSKGFEQEHDAYESLTSFLYYEVVQVETIEALKTPTGSISATVSDGSVSQAKVFANHEDGRVVELLDATDEISWNLERLVEEYDRGDSPVTSIGIGLDMIDGSSVPCIFRQTTSEDLSLADVHRVTSALLGKVTKDTDAQPVEVSGSDIEAVLREKGEHDTEDADSEGELSQSSSAVEEEPDSEDELDRALAVIDEDANVEASADHVDTEAEDVERDVENAGRHDVDRSFGDTDEDYNSVFDAFESASILAMSGRSSALEEIAKNADIVDEVPELDDEALREILKKGRSDGLSSVAREFDNETSEAGIGYPESTPGALPDIIKRASAENPIGYTPYHLVEDYDERGMQFIEESDEDIQSASTDGDYTETDTSSEEKAEEENADAEHPARNSISETARSVSETVSSAAGSVANAAAEKVSAAKHVFEVAAEKSEQEKEEKRQVATALSKTSSTAVFDELLGDAVVEIARSYAASSGDQRIVGAVAMDTGIYGTASYGAAGVTGSVKSFALSDGPRRAMAQLLEYAGRNAVTVAVALDMETGTRTFVLEMDDSDPAHAERHYLVAAEHLAKKCEIPTVKRPLSLVADLARDSSRLVGLVVRQFSEATRQAMQQR